MSNETDEELRARLVYCFGDSAAACSRISILSEEALDKYAEDRGLKRRRWGDAE